MGASAGHQRRVHRESRRFDDALDQRPLALDLASGRQPTGGHERSQSAPVDRLFFIPNYDAVVAAIAGLGEASKCPPTTVADYRTSRFASTASEAATE